MRGPLTARSIEMLLLISFVYFGNCSCDVPICRMCFECTRWFSVTVYIKWDSIYLANIRDRERRSLLTVIKIRNIKGRV